ncbi:hypothetical protein ACROYT_G015821 [Oculina patagonica]
MFGHALRFMAVFGHSNTSCFLALFLVALFSSLLATVHGSLSSSNIPKPPSPPRNLRWSVVGAMDPDREYRVYWSASTFTGGLPVNYSVKLCMNDSVESNNSACKWSSNPDCRPVHVLSTNKDFFCVLLNKQDFDPPLCGKICNYTISVVATNDVGSATSWRYLPSISTFSATPLPPLAFNVKTTDKDRELRVSWTARSSWKYYETEYTILYQAKHEMENKTKVISNKTEFTLLTQLEAFVEYYIYLMVRFVSEEGVRTAASEVQGPRIVKTPAGEPDTPSKVLKDQSVTFPGDQALRNVTVEWELADNFSWHGTPGQYTVYCNHHVLSQGSVLNCRYHVDATSNRTVLQALKSADRYSVYIQMCNKEGKCSSPSEPYIVKEVKDNITSPQTGGKLNSKQIALITVSVVVGCIIALFVICVIRKWRRGEIREVLLRDRVVLHAPIQQNYEYADPLPTHYYDALIPNENQV